MVRNQNISFSFINLLSLFIFISGLLFLLFNNVRALCLAAVILNAIFIIKFKENIPLLILFIFIFFYTYTFIYYFFFNYYLSVWLDFQSFDTFRKVLINHFLFIFFLGIITSGKIIYDFDLKLKGVIKSHVIIYFFLCLVFIVLIVFGISGENIFESGIYADSETMKKTKFHEYNIIVYLFLLIYSRSNRFYISLNTFLLLLFISKTLMYGGRIEVLEICLLYFYFYFVFKKKISYKHIFFLSIFGYFFMHIFQNVRSNPLALINFDAFVIFDFSELFKFYSSKMYIDSNQGDVIQSSARMIGLIDVGLIPFYNRIFGAVFFVFSIFLPSNILPDYSNLSVFKQELYSSGGGGLISTYFYAWFSYLGPIIIALFLGVVFNFFFKTTNKYVKVYGLTLLISFPRWFAYNPIQIVKFCLLSVIILFLIHLLTRIEPRENFN
jgi:hypothetical protein